MKKVYAGICAGLLLAGLNLNCLLGCGKTEEKKPETATEETPSQSKESSLKSRKAIPREVKQTETKQAETKQTETKQTGEKISRRTVFRAKPVEQEGHNLDIKPASHGDDDASMLPVEVPRAKRTPIPPVPAVAAPVEMQRTAKTPISPVPAEVAPVKTVSKPITAHPPATPMPPADPPVVSTPMPTPEEPVTIDEPTSEVEEEKPKPFQRYTDSYKRALPPSIERLEDGTISVRIGSGKEKGEGSEGVTPAVSNKSMTIGTPREPWQSRQTVTARTNAVGNTGTFGVPGSPPGVTIGGTSATTQHNPGTRLSGTTNQMRPNIPTAGRTPSPPVIPPPSQAAMRPPIQAAEPAPMLAEPDPEANGQAPQPIPFENSGPPNFPQ